MSSGRHLGVVAAYLTVVYYIAIPFNYYILYNLEHTPFVYLLNHPTKPFY